MDAILREVRYALRSIRTRPYFAATVMLTTALGVGAATLSFAAFDRMLLRPLQLPGSAPLYVVWERNDIESYPRMFVSPPTFDDWRRAPNTGFVSMSAYRPAKVTLGGSSAAAPEEPNAVRASAEILRTLGVQPLLGRGFLPDDDRVNAAPVALISEALWRRRYQGASDVIGRSVEINGVAHAIVGVLPARVPFPPPLALEGMTTTRYADVWLPLQIDYAGGQRGAHYLTVIARAAGNTPQATLQRRIAAISQRIALQDSENKDWTASVVALQAEVARPVRAQIMVLFAAGLLVLLIAIANIANLLLARALQRMREIQIRLALGAGRAAVIRITLLESLLLTLAGGVLGILLAGAAIQLVRSTGSIDLPRLDEVMLDPRITLAALCVSVLAGIIASLSPAALLRRVPVSRALRESAANIKGVRQAGFQRGFVLAQAALSFALLVAAGLLLKSFAHLSSADPGFRTDVMSLDIALRTPVYAERAPRARYTRELLQRVAEIPGVKSAAIVSDVPIATDRQGTSFESDGIQFSVPTQANFTFTSPAYFTTLGIALTRGRLPDARDDAQGAPIVVINEAFAKRYFPKIDPLGHTLTFGFNTQTKRTIVGVVANEKFLGVDQAAAPNAYVPYAQLPIQREISLVWRGDARTLTAVRAAARAADPALAVTNERTLAQIVHASLAGARLSAQLIGVFALIATVLTALGLFGVMSFLVRQRLSEIAVRMALGADAALIGHMILRDGTRLAALGIALGVPIALLLARAASGLLFEVNAWDAATYAAVLLVLGSTALLACWLPARWASSVSPLDALRSE